MTRITKTRAFVVLVLLVMSTGLMGLEARPLSISGTGEGVEVVDFFDWLSLGAIKESGPSPGGKGHRFTNSNTLGGIKDSGPSSGGEGHKFTNSETLGGIKESGPTPGQGH